jgi:hypothetical protein
MSAELEMTSIPEVNAQRPSKNPFVPIRLLRIFILTFSAVTFATQPA